MRKTDKFVIEKSVFPQSACKYRHAVFRHAVEFGLRTVVFFRIMQKLFGRGGESKPLRFARVILPSRDHFFFGGFALEGYENRSRMSVGYGDAQTLRRNARRRRVCDSVALDLTPDFQRLRR